jgi:putative methylase
LEQYITPSDIAADMLWFAYMANDLSSKLVFDLGCGTGRLSYGAALLEAMHVVCVDIDYDALDKARDFLEPRVSIPVSFIVGDVRESIPLREVRACTVVMNPPFGVHLRGADIDFIKAALSICETVYSLHKVSEGLFSVLSKVARESRSTFEVVKLFEFPIRWFLPKHRRKVHYVKTVLVRFRRRRGERHKLKVGII